ncbi:MAG: cytochrome c3 family protein [Prolixibacteraceae bacterium]|nr:cytochrome c3 family protein [Prolixibacteraceae bacterium]
MKHCLIIFTFILFTFYSLKSSGQWYDDPVNHSCLKCHAFQTYSFHNDLMDKEEKRLMNPFFIQDTVALKKGVHKQFDCTDCHSYEYETYPHSANLKLEPMATCLDCHGGDETFAPYQFEKIDEEVKKSIHYQVYGENFTCSKCHSQHTYTTTARNSNDVLEIVNYSNQICLSCHNDMRKYMLISGHENPKLVEIHNWLPNQELHFQHVRCIECHTEVVDGLMVSHNIQGKDKAVRKCAECHTSDSRLKSSLYKYQNLQVRSEGGVLNTIFSNDSYIIGMQESPFLKLASIIIFIATLGGIVIHLTFRIIKKK